MPRHGFGYEPFGNTPFGGADWCKTILWDSLPEQRKQSDLDSGGSYYKFVTALCPSWNYLVRYIRGFRDLTDYTRIRHDLLEYLGRNFGIEIDLEEPESYQRMRVGLAARWNIIKGTVNAYTVLCRVHGFECEVVPLWWTGDEYSETPPYIYGESSTYTYTSTATDDFTVQLSCYPVEPGSISLQFAKFAGGYLTVTDDGNGGWNEAWVDSGSIDYGWGVASVSFAPRTVSDFINSSYTSVVGGCPDTCRKCKTHKLRLYITPGDIAGQSELTIEEAFKRLYRKLGVLNGDGVLPVHVELEQKEWDKSIVLSLGYHYDVLAADDYSVDYGVRWVTP